MTDYKTLNNLLRRMREADRVVPFVKLLRRFRAELLKVTDKVEQAAYHETCLQVIKTKGDTDAIHAEIQQQESRKLTPWWTQLMSRNGGAKR